MPVPPHIAQPKGHLEQVNRRYVQGASLGAPILRDAERAISVLNRIDTALRNCMSRGNITIPYDEVASTWGARRRQRTKPKAKRKASLRKHGRH